METESPFNQENFEGTCMDMCPTEERAFREGDRNLSIFEMVPGTESNVRPDYPRTHPSLAIKKYPRAAAGTSVTIENVRPPSVLRATMQHIISEIVPREDVPFTEIYHFVRDRTRSIRQDFTFQTQTQADPISIVTHEQNARFLILSQHLLREENIHVFDPKMNMEQFEDCMESLFRFYSKHRAASLPPMPNEAEFRSYHLLVNLRDVPESLTGMNPQVRESPYIEFALQVAIACKNDNYDNFFKLVQDASFLQAVLMEKELLWCTRVSALRKISLSYITYPLEDFTEKLFFNDSQEALDFLNHFNIEVNYEEKIQFKRQYISHQSDKPFKSMNCYIVDEKLEEYGSYSEIVGDSILPDDNDIREKMLRIYDEKEQKMIDYDEIVERYKNKQLDISFKYDEINLPLTSQYTICKNYQTPQKRSRESIISDEEQEQELKNFKMKQEEEFLFKKILSRKIMREQKNIERRIQIEKEKNQLQIEQARQIYFSQLVRQYVISVSFRFWLYRSHQRTFQARQIKIYRIRKWWDHWQAIAKQRAIRTHRIQKMLSSISSPYKIINPLGVLSPQDRLLFLHSKDRKRNGIF